MKYWLLILVAVCGCNSGISCDYQEIETRRGQLVKCLICSKNAGTSVAVDFEWGHKGR